MTKRNLLFLALLTYSLFAICQKTDQEKYIDRWSDIAIEEMERAGIPASIKLAQGLLESGAGTSTLAEKANNHFGIKCGGQWNGRTYYHKDDDRDSNGNLIKSCFRAYRSAEASYRAHSDFLKDQNKTRYNFLFELDPYDYEAWAHGLKKAGYATSKRYGYHLIDVINKYNLDRFDRMSSGNRPNNKPTKDLLSGRILRINDVKVVLASTKDTPRTLSRKYNIPLKKLYKYNEKISSPTQKLSPEERVYLQCKRKHWRGKEKYHYVKKGETMFDIAQKYALRLEKLYRKNRMDEGTQPAENAKIKIRGWRVKKGKTPKLTKKNKSGEEYLFEDEEEIENKKDDNEYNPPKSEEIDESQANYHIVRPGQTLYGISKEHKTTVKRIKELNGLTGNTIYKGQRLRIR